MSNGAKEISNPSVESEPLEDEMKKVFSEEYDKIAHNLDPETEAKFLTNNEARDKYIENQISDTWNIADIIHKAEFQKFIDPLTGLPNRRGFDLTVKIIQNFLVQHPDARAYAIAFDLDNFKKVNDQYGHETGDDVLKAIAELLKRDVRQGDAIARLGGEEFGAVIVDKGPTFENQHAQRLNPIVIANRLLVDIRKAVAAKTPIKDQGASIGVAEIKRNPLNGHPISPSEALQQADIAAYHAKTSGKNRVIVHQPNMTMSAK